MYSRKRAKLPDNITLDWILSKVTEYDIYAKYIGQFKVGMIYNSPFRKDKNPSFGIYYSKRTKQLLFKDHGTGECGNVIKFVSLFTGKTEYNDILSDIVDKLNITNNTKLVSSKQYIPPTETVIGVVRQEFTDVDINYWKQFNISINTLKKFNVNSIKYYLCNGIVRVLINEKIQCMHIRSIITLRYIDHQQINILSGETILQTMISKAMSSCLRKVIYYLLQSP